MALSAKVDASSPVTASADLVTEARRLRDYLTRIGSRAGPKLVSALAPFDRSQSSPPTDEEKQKLYIALQTAHEEAAKTIDKHTINEVMIGRTPYGPLRKRAIAGAAILTFTGIVLVVWALFYTFWANRAMQTIDRADRFLEYDHFGQVMSLVQFEKFFENTPEGQEAEDFEPFVMFLQEIGHLGTHYIDEKKLPAAIATLTIGDNPVFFVRNAVKSSVCPDWLTGDRPPRLLEWMCPVKPSWWDEAAKAEPASSAADVSRGTQLVSASSGSGNAAAPATRIGAGATGAASPKWLRASVDNVRERRNEIMVYAGRETELSPPYDFSRSTISDITENLRGKLENVQRVWLPIIYGFIGSVVYCMWRVLSPGIISYGPVYTLMRTAFAGLAAVTLSMILIPSNTLAAGSGTSHPLIYLLAFVFGYSVETFVNVLNNMNNLALRTLRPREQTQ